jgi:cytochrome c-type biogenesis protein CcmH/NrfG
MGASRPIVAAASTTLPPELAGRNVVPYPCRMTGHSERQDAERRAAVESLDRLRYDGDGLLSSALAQEARRAAAPAADADDPAEVWGRRIGRGLSIAAFLALLVYLSVTYLP